MAINNDDLFRYLYLIAKELSIKAAQQACLQNMSKQARTEIARMA